MVCIPCIVIPLLLWVYHKFLQPWVMKFWKKESQITDDLKGPPLSGDPNDKTYLYIQGKITDNPVMVFSKKSCGFCTMAKEVLDKIQVEYENEDITNKKDCAEMQAMFQKMTGGRTVPRVFIGGKCVGGGSETYTLHNQGKLVPMCEKAGAKFKNKKAD